MSNICNLQHKCVFHLKDMHFTFQTIKLSTPVSCSTRVEPDRVPGIKRKVTETDVSRGNPYLLLNNPTLTQMGDKKHIVGVLRRSSTLRFDILK